MKTGALLVPLALAALSACTSVEPDPFLTASVGPQAPPIASEVAPGFAVAMLPVTGGAIRVVRQTVRTDHLEQQIVYETPGHGAGENLVRITLGKTDGDRSLLRAPSRRQILSEMRQLLPGMVMTIRASSAENGQGPYGYATGDDGHGGACLYGWQLFNPDRGRSALALMTDADRTFRAQLRLRYCHPDMNEEQIVSLMQGLRVKPITAETLALLQFASGSGENALPLAATRDSPEPEPPTVRKAINGKAAQARFSRAELDAVVLPISRKSSMPSEFASAAGATIGAAVRVPLPPGREPDATPVAVPAVAVPLPQATGSPPD